MQYIAVLTVTIAIFIEDRKSCFCLPTSRESRVEIRSDKVTTRGVLQVCQKWFVLSETLSLTCLNA